MTPGFSQLFPSSVFSVLLLAPFALGKCDARQFHVLSVFLRTLDGQVCLSGCEEVPAQC